MCPAPYAVYQIQSSPLQVKGWGSGEAAALENLQVDSFSGAMIEDAQPFYVSLARQLELLEVDSQGRICNLDPWR